MRKDLAKVLTEKPRSGSGSKNLKTRFHEKGFDSREEAENKYSLPKRGKMLMHNRDLGPWNTDKEFTDVLGPLRKWVEAQVGRNWDKVYSEIKSTFPNTNKQNHNLLDTHLLGYIHRNVRVEKGKKGRRVYTVKYYWDRKHPELHYGDIYVDPDTHVLMQYKRNKMVSWHHKDPPPTTATGYLYGKAGDYGKPDFNKVILGPNEYLEKRGLTWVYCQYKMVEVFMGDKLLKSGLEVAYHHVLSKKELNQYGVSNGIECDGKFRKMPMSLSYSSRNGHFFACSKCKESFTGVNLKDGPKKHAVRE
jgi:hypothetical protein